RHLRGGAPIRPAARADVDHASSVAADPHQHLPRIREGHYWHRLDASIRYRAASAARAHKIEALGGIDAIAISHPHFYTTMVEWAHEFLARIHLHAGDKQWIMRNDPAIELWDGGTKRLWEGLTLVRCGGHFEAGTVLHWAGGAGGRGAVCAGDILTVTTDRKWLSFMRSYANFIPLSARTGEHIDAVLKPFAFEAIYGHYFERVIAHDAKGVLETSGSRYVAAIEGKRGYE